MRSARIAALVGALALTGCGGERPAPTEPEPPAFAVHREARGAAPAAQRGRYVLARLRAATWLRSAPGGPRRARLARRTEFGSPRVLSVTGRRGGWLRVLAPELPNGAAGWIPARRVALGGTDVSLVIDRSRHELRLRRGGRILRRVTVAVGRPANPTPLGRFAVTDKLRTRDPGSPYGCCAIALTGHQTRLVPGWPGGDRLAVHGTPQPETVGRAVSLGCLRAGRRDIRALMRAVPLGAPVIVRA